MPRIFYTAENYQAPYQGINTDNEEFILCRKLDLYRAIITVGNPSFLTWGNIRQFGLFRAISNSIIEKAMLVQINIESNLHGIYLHPIFKTYVSDHKRNVSYNLGMAVAKLYAEKLLGIPNLIHVESLKKQNAITFVNSNGRTREPDLVGMTSNGEWHVFEAKGMSTDHLNTKVEDAKEQARKIDTIHGNPPSTASACATYFGTNRIISKIVDPPNDGDKELELDIAKFYESYYSPFFAIGEYSQRQYRKNKIADFEYNTFNIRAEKLNLTIGLETEVFELLMDRNYSEINSFYYKKRQPIIQESNLDNRRDSLRQVSVGMDGFIIKYANY